MVISTLVALGKARYVCSQNVDSLHLRSGVPRPALAELHGNCFAERCQACRSLAAPQGGPHWGCCRLSLCGTHSPSPSLCGTQLVRNSSTITTRPVRNCLTGSFNIPCSQRCRCHQSRLPHRPVPGDGLATAALPA
ncbi:hypothetical protein V8C86DRAFT_78882 [Haematococcus lacustris]